MLMKKHPVNDGVTRMHDPDEPVSGLEGRFRIWETSHCFKCPVVGMCLNLAEQRQLLKKMGLLKKNDSPFEMHEKMVSVMDSENRLSRRIDNLLERKFGKQAAVLLKLDEKAILAHFKEALASGDAAAVLWATAVGPDLSTACRREIFGDIHMTMHWNGEQLMQFKRKLSRQQHDLDRVQQRFNDSARQRRSLKKEVNSHKREQKDLLCKLSAATIENCTLHKTLHELSSRDGTYDQDHECRRLQLVCEGLGEQLAAAQVKIATLEEKNSQLLSQLGQQLEMEKHFREEARAIITEMSSMNRCDESCPSFDLCRKRILIVGGVTRMESLYRELIEGSNGVFEYHDGYVKKGARDIESRLKRADMVLCPVNCNSHAACSIVKNLGKKHNKTVHILANLSLSTVS